MTPTQTPVNIAVVFGGISPEHEVSVISALQAAAAMNRIEYKPIPVYISKDGEWFTGKKLLDPQIFKDLDAVKKASMKVHLVASDNGRAQLEERVASKWHWSKPWTSPIDVVFIGLHGGNGENGAIQGLCEMLNVPYTGSSVFGSALGMDKVLTKMICRDQKIPVVEFVFFRESEWANKEEQGLDLCEMKLGYPVVVKPARLGSSIGIAKAGNREELNEAIEESFRYDEKIVVEKAVSNLREVNCAVLGDTTMAIPSVLEEPVPVDDSRLLSFKDKYMRGETRGAKTGPRTGGSKTMSREEGMAALDRIIPAQLPEGETTRIQNMAVQIFKLFECGGVARLDFMIDDDTNTLYFNEINTIPGSFSFYLWNQTNIDFRELTHRMIQLALQRHRNNRNHIQSYEVNLLSERSLEGIKGTKS